MAIFLSWLGYSVTSVDIDPKVIDKARAEAARFNGRVDWTVADAFRLPFPDQSFDLAFHQGLFEHFSNEQIWQMLDEQLRVAKKVIFSVPNQYYPKKDFGNERLMSKKQWDNLLSRYRVVKSTNYSPKRFPKFYLPRVPIQYLAVIEPKLQ